MSRPERRLQFRIAWRLGYAHPDQMLAGMDSRQVTEMYAFARIEPLDQPLQDMLAQLTDVLARVHGNDTTPEQFLLVKPQVEPVDETKARSQQIMELFQAAAARNSVH